MRTIIFLLLSLFLFPVFVYAEENPPPDTTSSEKHPWNWEYVVSRPPNVFYVDTTKEHIFLPEENIAIYYMLKWNSSSIEETYTIIQMALRLNDDHSFSVRSEYMIVLNKKREIIRTNESLSDWASVPKGAPIIQAAELLYKRGLI